VKQAMGSTINAQSNPDSDFIKAVDLLGESLLTRLTNPLYWPDFLFPAIYLRKKYYETWQYFTILPGSYEKEKERAIG